MNLNDYAIVRAMRVVLTRPIKKFSIVELAKETRLAPSAAKYALDYMLKRGLVKDGRIGRIHQYQADLYSYLTRQWKIVFSLEDLHNAKVVEGMLRTRKSILNIALYGSVATGRDDEKSDVDILVIADTDLNGKKEIIAVGTRILREINISVYTPLEWRRKAQADKVFYENVILDSIALYGEKPVVL